MARFASAVDSQGQYVDDGTAAIAAVSTSAAASTAKVLGTVTGLSKFDELEIVFTASNALAGGPCDYVIQRIGPDGNWDDYVYLGQQTAGAALTAAVSLPIAEAATSEAAGGVASAWTPHDTNTDATIALTAKNARHGRWGSQIRVVSRTGALVSAAAVTNTYIRGISWE